MNIGSTLVLGVGNILLQDEGIGVRVVERLNQTCSFSDEVQVLDGGTMGLDLIGFLDGVERLLVIDAVEAGRAPGELVRMVDEEIPSFLAHKISPHQVGLSDILSAARLLDILPRSVVLLGVQPASLQTGLELSAALSARVDDYVQAVINELHAWGVECTNSP